jgi:queuine/archaeosine tRNA-ribosyltransferase
MTNFTEFMGARNRNSLELRAAGLGAPKESPKIISDSGGFQILTGKLDYIDPLEIITWYNKNVDIGIVLDIPPWMTSKEVLLRMAKVQKKNTDILLANKEPHVELMNIFHGNTTEDRKMFRKIVEDPRIERLAIGGSYTKSILRSIYDLILIANTGKKYKQYHLLGVTNLLQLVAMMRLTHKGLIPHVTSDSSTHIQKAFLKEYLHQAHLTSNIVHLQIGRNHVYPSMGNRLPCSCPLCSRVKYADVFSLLDGSAVNVALAFHNMYTYNEYVSRMRDVVGLPLKDLTDLIAKQLGSRHGIKEAIDALKFIDLVEEEGLTKAAKKYEYFIEHNLIHQAEVSLFKGVETADNSEFVARMDKVISRYESGEKEVKEVGASKRKKVSMRVTRSQSKSSKKKSTSKKKVKKVTK